MTDFLSAIGSFIAGLLALEVPGIGVPMGVLILGLWLFYAVGRFVVQFFYGGDDQ